MSSGNFRLEATPHLEFDALTLIVGLHRKEPNPKIVSKYTFPVFVLTQIVGPLPVKIDLIPILSGLISIRLLSIAFTLLFAKFNGSPLTPHQQIQMETKKQCNQHQ